MKARQSNIELLRILCMFLIVLGHATTHGYDIAELPNSANGLISIAMTQGARIAVDVFVIINGYFTMAESIKWKKVWNLYAQIWFYSVIIFWVVTYLTMDFSWRQMLNAILPIYSSQYWFATCYILLMLVSPFLNIMINGLEKRQHEILLIIIIISMSVLPTFLPHINPSYFNNFIWFIALYLIGAYLRKYEPKFVIHIKWWHGVSFLGMIMLGSVSLFSVGYDIAYLRHNSIYLLAEPNKLTAIICAIAIFVGFKNLNMAHHNIINTVSALVFAVYLITDHPTIREYIFRPITGNIDNDYYLIIYFGWTAFIFLLCVLIELFRKFMTNKCVLVCNILHYKLLPPPRKKKTMRKRR